MIQNKKDLIDYLNADRIQLGIKRKKPRIFADEIWKYEIYLRKYEYYTNTNKTIRKNIYKYMHHRQGVKLGISIPPNVCKKGLSIAHFGCIQINDKAKIGENLRIHEGVTIGASGGGAPIIGNNVFLASGCKVIGELVISNNVAVGANAVVVKSINKNDVTYAGVPAKKVSDNNSEKYVFWYRINKGENE